MLILFLDRLDITIVNVAIPTITTIYNISINATALILTSFALMLYFIKIERHNHNPIINFEYFKGELFTKSILIQLFFQMSHFGSFFVIGLYLQCGIGFSPEKAGIIIAMQAVGAIVIKAIPNSYLLKIGLSKVFPAGLLGVAIITPFILTIVNTHQFIYGCAIMLFRGLFSGLVGPLLQSMSMYDDHVNKSDIGKISSIFNISRQISISLGVGISGLAIGIMHNLYNLNYANTQIFFTPSLLLISVFCIIGAIIALQINDSKIRNAIS